MEQIFIFLDHSNIAVGAPHRRYLDFGNLKSYLSSGGIILEAFAYVPIDPRRPMEAQETCNELWDNGWCVQPKIGKLAGNGWKGNVDVEMAIDIMRIAVTIKPDIIVICSGDGDMLPVVRELRKMGIRVEIASFRNCLDRTLRRESSGFICLDTWLEESAAAGAADMDAPDAEELFAEDDTEPEAVPRAHHTRIDEWQSPRENSEVPSARQFSR